MSYLIKKEGFEFAFDPKACESCDGNCCRGESGYIWVTKKEIEEIADFLQMDKKDFMEQCLKKVGYRFTLKEIRQGEEYLCLFFDPKKKRCEIYPVRPRQCRTFPFWEQCKDPKNLQKVCEECKGIYPFSS